MNKKIEIEIEKIPQSGEKRIKQIEGIKRTVKVDGSIVFYDYAAPCIYNKNSDPIKFLENWLTQQSQSSNNSRTDRRNQVGFFKKLWLKLFR